MAGPERDWPGVRLHVVSGKGGTGKTTVAAALALALARGGRRVLLCEAEGRQGIAQLFDALPLPYAERPVASRPDGGTVTALAIDPEAALLEYLDMYYRMGRAGRMLERVGAIDFVTTIAPGLRDVLLTGKVYEAVRRTRHGTDLPVYNSVVLDAPPTGRIARFLAVSAGVVDLAKVGPIRHQAESILGLMRSSRTACHLVTLAEEMPVQETTDAIGELRAARIPVGGIVVNKTRHSPLSREELHQATAGELPVDDLAGALRRAGVPADSGVVAGLLRETAEGAGRTLREDDELKRVAELGRPTYDLPQLADGIDLGGLYELADLLIAQGMA